jgi:cytoplasmic iron level regulating protein YaaA (DUF328/UPF0246 family)
MIILLSPTKQMSLEPMREGVRPVFANEAETLAGKIRELPPGRLKSMMNLSEKLSHDVYALYQNFGNRKTAAVFAYTGTVFSRIDASSLTQQQLEFAQNHIRILSGLYGLLRPLDLISAYRLEMSAPVHDLIGQSLASYWKPKVSEQLTSESDPIYINLASAEYIKAVDIKGLSRMISIQFKTSGANGLRTVGMYAKQARGEMVSQILRSGINDPERLKSLNVLGFRYERKLSSDRQWVFVNSSS